MLVLAGVTATAVICVFLFVAILARQGPSTRPSIAVGRQPTPTTRPITEIARRLPTQFRFLAPLLPVQRAAADATREAAGALLVVLLVGGALVLGHDQVVRVQASTAGDGGEQVRILGIGLGVIVAVASGLFLGFFVLLRSLVALAPGNVPFGLQTIVSLLAVVLLILGVAALLGFTALSWRIGVNLFSAQAWRSVGERIPPGLATIVVAVGLYLVAQIPVVGTVIAALVLAYSLGAFVRSRIVRPSPARPA